VVFSDDLKPASNELYHVKHEQTTSTLISNNACLLSFVPEAFVFHFAIQKYK
jgi:hypothetical protein